MKIRWLKNLAYWLVLTTVLSTWPVFNHRINQASVHPETPRLVNSRQIKTGLGPTQSDRESIPFADTSIQLNHEISNTYGQFPLSFEANQGQADPIFDFLSRGQGYSLFLSSTEAEFQFPIAQEMSNAECRMPSESNDQDQLTGTWNPFSALPISRLSPTSEIFSSRIRHSTFVNCQMANRAKCA